MTDFVLQIDKLRPRDLGQDFSSWNLSKLITIENYAKFLKQPLKLEMFVPCDDEGIVLEEPKIEEEYVDEHTTQIFAQYQYDLDKAKEKVLFEGFEEMKNAAVRDCVWIKDTETKFHIDARYGTTVEHLIKSNLKLTQTALNAIFG